MIAYKNQSKEQLKEFFKEWNSKTDSCINSQRFESIQKEVTDLYLLTVRDSVMAKIRYYSPLNYPRDSVTPDFSNLKSSFYNNLYYKNRYLAIPEEVKVTISEFVNGKKAKNNLKDTSVIFAPRLNIDKLHLLHVNKKYFDIVNRFLGAMSYYSKEEIISGKCLNYDEIEKRVKFLKQELDLSEGHWGDCWFFTVNPYVYEISFNEKLSLAEVSISTGYSTGATALFRKLNGKWCFEDVISGWIE